MTTAFVFYPTFESHCPTCNAPCEVVATRGPVDPAPLRHCRAEGHPLPGAYGYRRTLPGETPDFPIEG